MSRRLVWLPFEPSWPVPAGIRCELVELGSAATGLDEVEFVVLPYGATDAQLRALRRMPRLAVVQSQAAGTERVAPFVPPGVRLCSGRGVHDTATAELAVALALTMTRDLPDYLHDQAERRWRPRVSQGLADQRVVVIGFGSVGSAIGARLRAFEAEVVGIARTARVGVRAMSALPEVLPGADVVILAVPLTDETRGMVDKAFLDLLKPGALLINVARGAVVVTEDLLKALNAGRISAALDVTDPEPPPADSPLWDAPNCVLTPHVGARSRALQPRIQALVRDQVTRFADGRELRNLVR
ncbi:2-hydroxyacid dehydrogenase [Mycolicibacterium tokaiense]|uniref:2-hydroxyacid dehydrogenase n=1 Tax=Mycolicibacterium tokaiense TaxID=39695 RepID=UPI000E1C140D|nr:2-hydroxyacid dehydrogenase [Mycolicibacterium tokaiense]BBY89407.1 dehydrogenase [Mycolicibacterium tokaiense]